MPKAKEGVELETEVSEVEAVEYTDIPLAPIGKHNVILRQGSDGSASFIATVNGVEISNNSLKGLVKEVEKASSGVQAIVIGNSPRAEIITGYNKDRGYRTMSGQFRRGRVMAFDQAILDKLNALQAERAVAIAALKVAEDAYKTGVAQIVAETPALDPSGLQQIETEVVPVEEEVIDISDNAQAVEPIESAEDSTESDEDEI